MNASILDLRYKSKAILTDLFIWVQKGHPKAAEMIEESSERFLSVQSRMELLQCAQNRK